MTTVRSNPILPIVLPQAVKLTQRLYRRVALDEEVITDAFLGVLFASMAWATAAARLSDDLRQRCQWGRYRKYRDRRSWNREATSGADFALLVADGPTNVRIALFQAKLPEKRVCAAGKKRYGIDVHHRSKSKTGSAPFTQMHLLAQFAAKLMAAAPPESVRNHPEMVAELKRKTRSTSPSIDGMDWVHYLAYAPRFLASPLTSFEAEYEVECTSTNSVNFTHLPSGTRPFQCVIEDCFTPEHQGWISVRISEAIAILPDLIELMPMHYVDSDGALAAALATLQLKPEIVMSRQTPTEDLSAIVESLPSMGFRPASRPS